MSEKDEGFVDFSQYDDAVAASLDNSKRQKVKDGRGKPGHAGQVGVDKSKYPKSTYRMPLKSQMLVRQMAKEENVSQAVIVEIALVAFYIAWKTGILNLDDMKVVARSLRVDSKLVIPDDYNPFFLVK